MKETDSGRERESGGGGGGGKGTDRQREREREREREMFGCFKSQLVDLCLRDGSAQTVVRLPY